MFLGPPQTTRQSRTLAMLGMIGAVSLLRLVGFVSVIVGVRVPRMLVAAYVAIFGSIVGGLVADFARPSDRARHRECPGSRRAIGERIARATA